MVMHGMPISGSRVIIVFSFVKVSHDILGLNVVNISKILSNKDIMYNLSLIVEYFIALASIF